jgi:CubicO group peptidase (beta-lactamase class C family)
MTLAKTLLVALAAFVVIPAGAQAQDASATPAAAPPVATPRAPIPYTTLAPRPKPKPSATASTSAAPAASPTASSAPAVAPRPGARLTPGEPLPAPELEAYVDGLVKDAMDREHIAGVTVSIVQNGQVVLKKGYGAASLSPARKVDPDTTLFRLGSISKTFTWIALMREVEAGRIRINAPVNLYLPESLWVRDQGYRTQVTVLNLMDHSAGFEDRALGHLMEKNPARERSLADYLRQERPRRVHAPGQMSSYSNYGAGLAGEAVSYVTGRPFERLLEDEIFTPLALRHTTFREIRPAERGLPGPMPQTLAADVADGYRWTPTGFAKRPYEYIGHVAPAGAASSTAGDMARYMMMLLNGGTLDGATIYGPKAAEAFHTPIRRTPPGINGWRHGFMEYALPGGYAGYGHAGATLSFMSNMVLVPDLGMGVFISTNTETGAGLSARFGPRIVQQFYAPPLDFPRAGDPELTQVRGLYEGHYLGTRRAYGGLEALVGRAIAGMDVSVTDDGRLVTASGDQVRAWVPEGEPAAGRFISVNGPERLVFDMSGGRASRILVSTNTQVFERTGFWDEPQILMLAGIATAVAALATLAGIFLRNRREFRETSIQGRASLVQNIQAVLWVTCLCLFAVWLAKTSDVASVMYGWPGVSLLIASACAIVAALLTILTAAILPGVWRGGRRVDSWTAWRKAGYAATVLIYMGFSALLFFWGALTPWAA